MLTMPIMLESKLLLARQLNSKFGHLIDIIVLMLLLPRNSNYLVVERRRGASFEVSSQQINKQNTPKEDSYSAKTCLLDQTFKRGEGRHSRQFFEI